MAETLISPGVLAREQDQSQITARPVQAGAAIIGPTVLGPVMRPTLITSYSEYLATFGGEIEIGDDEYSYFTSISAFNYFQGGGNTLLVTRVVSGSFSPAVSTAITNNNETEELSNLTGVTVTPGFNITGSSGTKSAIESSNVNVTASFVLANSESISSITLDSATGNFAIGDTITFTSASLGASQAGGADLSLVLVADNITNQTAFTLETLSQGIIMNSDSAESAKGALADGTSQNLRFEISNPDTGSGTFSLLVRRGDDNTKSKRVLETYTGLSLDPKSSGYIARVIGDQTTTLRDSGTAEPYLQITGNFPNASRYVRVKSVNAKTPNYFDNDGDAKAKYTGSIPVSQGGSFKGATGTIDATTANEMYDNAGTATQGLEASNYTDAINLLGNKDDFRYNVISVPGLNAGDHASTINQLNSVVSSRGDAIAVIDLLSYGKTIANAVAGAKAIDSSYAATYWPWCQISDPSTGQLAWVPASTLIPGVYASNDATAEAWFAPAGINRGGLGSVRQAERKLTQSNRDTLYVGKVNPLATFPGRGVVVFGQKTLQTQASALDRVNVRRLLIALKNFISQVADNLVFEQNTAATRNNFLGQVNPYLESVQQRQGLFAFKVVMDDSNNTPDVIDRNELIGQIYVQPTKTAEFIYLDFNILPTGATFPA